MGRYIRQIAKVIALSTAAGVILQGLPSWAAFNPPNKKLRRPGNRQAAATRGCSANLELPLTALVPLSNTGVTTASHPTFHWYMPTDSNHPKVEFVLYRVNNMEPRQEEEIYKTQSDVNQQAGIASVQLPAEQSPLEVGQEYHWQANLLCYDYDLEEYVVSQSVDGWVTRVASTPALTDKLNSAEPIDQIDILAEEGLWYSALTQLTTLQQTDPEHPRLETEWQALFSSEFVELAHIPSQPMAHPEE